MSLLSLCRPAALVRGIKKSTFRPRHHLRKSTFRPSPPNREKFVSPVTTLAGKSTFRPSPPGREKFVSPVTTLAGTLCGQLAIKHTLIVPATFRAPVAP